MFRPPKGHRTLQAALVGLFIGAGLFCYGLYKNNDPMALGTGIAAMVASVMTPLAWRGRAEGNAEK